MSGDITVQSEPGMGSVFTATIVQGVADPEPMGDLKNFSVIRTDAHRASFTAPEAEILVVDDLPSNLMVAEGLLVPYQMRVFTCLNGREAVDLVRERVFDLVLMDHMMPEMDGVDAVKAIRALGDERRRAMPIIALTANAVTGMREMFLANSFNDFLSKPIETIKLDEVLKRWVPENKRRKAPDLEDERSAALAEKLALPKIAGLDIEVGIARTGGDSGRFLDLLKMYHKDAQAVLEKLENGPEEESLVLFTTMVHGQKSALANIGADSLSSAASFLENAGRNQDMAVIHDRLPAFLKELTELAARIGEAVAETRNLGGGTQDGTDSIGALKFLQACLETKDIDGTDAALARLRDIPLDDRTRAVVSEIADLVLTADLDKALEAVDALLVKGKENG
jgi:CheY-like chemotaxis protein